MGAAGLVTIAAVLLYFSLTLPKLTSLDDYRPPIPSKILAKDGTVLAEIGIEKREVVAIEDIPKIIIDAFLSAEDDAFFQHDGVDYFGIARAMLANLKAGRIVQGGSTITQQVAKSFLLSNRRSITRKIKDFLLAQRIEKHMTKEDILYLYLNQVYLGGGYYGIKAAVKGYFGKQLDEITIAEAAMIAGLLVAPGRYSPYHNPSAAISRQKYVLRRMFEVGKITRQDYDEALDEDIHYRKRRPSTFKAGHFTDWIRQQAIEKIGEEEFLSGGFTIGTTLDWPLQQTAEKTVYAGVKDIDKRQGFKGPVEHRDNGSWEEFSTKQRMAIYQEASTYFTIEQGQIKEEFSLGETEMADIYEHRRRIRSKIGDKRFTPGIRKGDPLGGLIEVGGDKFYKALVSGVDDRAQIIYVDIAGVPGIIPLKNFDWAHKREISESRKIYYKITKPSSILKRGDVVHVTIQKKSVPLGPHTPPNFRKYIRRQGASQEIGRQRYLLCMLDQIPEVQGALVSLSPSDGDIVAFVGGTDFSKSQFNRVIQSKRQPGSAFKPILYAAALERGFQPNSIVLDSPEALGGSDESLNWKPQNYDGKFRGPMTLREALEVSRNIPTIKIAQSVGLDGINDYIERIGFDVELDQDLSFSLGSFGATLISLTKTYGIFPNGGKPIHPRPVISIADRDGEPWPDEEEQEPPAEQAHERIKEESNPFLAALDDGRLYDPRLSYIMTNLLKGVVLHGTGRRARSVSTFLGGKTGTTNNYVDAWFIGFSSNNATGVWTGFDDNRTMGMGETGAQSALPIWNSFMAEVIKKFGDHDFPQPPGIINVMIDKKSGRPTRADQKSFIEAFVEGFEPGAEHPEEATAEISDDATIDMLEDEEYYNIR